MKINIVKIRLFSGRSGFSLFEVMVVIFFISVLGVVALDYYYKILVDIERTSMVHDLGVMRSAVNMQAAKAYISGDKLQLKNLIGSNPVDLLQDQPENYAGDVSSADIDTVNKGSWFFDPRQGVLNYLVRNQLYFESEQEGSGVARFKIEPVYGDQKVNDGVRAVNGLVLKELEAYHWKRPWD